MKKTLLALAAIAAAALPSVATAAAPDSRCIVRYKLTPSYVTEMLRWTAASGRAAMRGDYLPIPARLLVPRRIALYHVDPRTGRAATRFVPARVNLRTGYITPRHCVS